VAEIKVTDKRMFTADGRLREEIADDAAPPSPTEPDPVPAAEVPTAADPRLEEHGAPPGEPFGVAPDGPRLEIPGTPPGLGPTFLDLVAVLAEPVSIYLGDVELPDGRTAENLEAARFHIDLLDVLRQRTAGSVSAQERLALDDLLYRMRMRYVQKRG
jgi:hypothetical protein